MLCRMWPERWKARFFSRPLIAPHVSLSRASASCSSVSLAPLTYAAWCLSWCSSMISRADHRLRARSSRTEVQEACRRPCGVPSDLLLQATCNCTLAARDCRGVLGHAKGPSREPTVRPPREGPVVVRDCRSDPGCQRAARTIRRRRTSWETAMKPRTPRMAAPIMSRSQGKTSSGRQWLEEHQHEQRRPDPLGRPGRPPRHDLRGADALQSGGRTERSPERA